MFLQNNDTHFYKERLLEISRRRLRRIGRKSIREKRKDKNRRREEREIKDNKMKETDKKTKKRRKKSKKRRRREKKKKQDEKKGRIKIGKKNKAHANDESSLLLHLQVIKPHPSFHTTAGMRARSLRPELYIPISSRNQCRLLGS